MPLGICFMCDRISRIFWSVQKVSQTMFKLSKRADYGLIAVKHLAMHRQQHACSANEIAEEYGISATLMAKVLQKLAHRFLVVAKHGSSGGRQPCQRPPPHSAPHGNRAVHAAPLNPLSGEYHRD